MNSQEDRHSLLVDSSIYIFRAWYTWSETLTDATGMPANAVHGFAEFIYELLNTHRPDRIAFAFDETREGSQRQKIFPAYKANRPPAPPELRHQFKLCRWFVSALGINMLAQPGYEADDLLGTLVKAERAEGRPVALLTGDKDLAQLIMEGDIWWDYARGRRLGPKEIECVFGVRPELIADQLALAGDKIDNIPGIPGIGMTTAARLLRSFDNLEALFADIPRIGKLKMRGALRLMHLVEEHQGTARLARRLTGIDCDVPLDTSRSTLPGNIDHNALESCFEIFRFSEYQKARWYQLLSVWPTKSEP